MKRKKSLIKFLRISCVIGEVFAGISLAVIILMVPFSEAMVDSRQASIGMYVDHGSPDLSFNVRLLHSSDGNFSFGQRGSHPGKVEYGNISFGPFRLRPNPSLLPLVLPDATAQAVVIDSLEGTVTIKRPENAADVLASVKWPFVASMICTAGAGLAILELLRRMFRSGERDEVFTADNIRNVRRIGFLLIASSLVKLFAAAWLASRMAAYITLHVANGKMSLESSSEGNLHGLVTGLVVLALAEVFRQGLTLKEENQLTI